MKIGELAQRTGVTVDTVRFYERCGILPHPRRTESGYRTYAAGAVDRIRLARDLKALGLTLAEVVAALQAFDTGDASCDSELWRLDAVLERVDAQLTELRALRRRIVQARNACNAGACELAGLAPEQH